jgi:hypothetical protein
MTRLAPHELNDPQVWRAGLGRRATMRLRNPDDPDLPFTEAAGVIQSVDRDEDGRTTVTLITRRGEARSAVIADVLAAKIF